MHLYHELKPHRTMVCFRNFHLQVQPLILLSRHQTQVFFALVLKEESNPLMINADFTKYFLGETEEWVSIKFQRTNK